MVQCPVHYVSNSLAFCQLYSVILHAPIFIKIGRERLPETTNAASHTPVFNVSYMYYIVLSLLHHQCQ